MEKPSVIQRRRSLKRHAQRTARRVLPFLASLFLATPLATPISKTQAQGQTAALRAPAPARVQGTLTFAERLRPLYDRLGVAGQGLRFEVFAKAMTGYLNLQQQGRLGEQPRLTVVDFDLPSTSKRLWVLDLATDQVLFHTLVAHGHNSGENEATTFSNTTDSNMSSLGFYVTASEYEGKHGRSLKLEGLDEGFNTNAEARSIVLHGADYVSEDFIRQNGRLGRSLGCPALPLDQYSQIIDTVSGGTCLFVNKSGAGYESPLLNEQVALAALATAPSPAS